MSEAIKLAEMLIRAKAAEARVKDLESSLEMTRAMLQEAERPRDRERIEFIRRAAIALYTEHCGPDYTTADAWEMAGQLWEGKPEGAW